MRCPSLHKLFSLQVFCGRSNLSHYVEFILVEGQIELPFYAIAVFLNIQSLFLDLCNPSQSATLSDS